MIITNNERIKDIIIQSTKDHLHTQTSNAISNITIALIQYHIKAQMLELVWMEINIKHQVYDQIPWGYYDI